MHPHPRPPSHFSVSVPIRERWWVLSVVFHVHVQCRTRNQTPEIDTDMHMASNIIVKLTISHQARELNQSIEFLDFNTSRTSHDA